MVSTTAARYRDADGVWHTLEVRNTAGGWQVVAVGSGDSEACAVGAAGRR